MSTEEDVNPYELLGLGLEATDQEIKSAYRKLSLKVHPDRNPNNPLAAQKFHELNQAYELLLDPLRRLALTSSVRAKEARKARFAKYDQKRKDLQNELEEREREFKRRKMDKAKEERDKEQENERIKRQGRKLREERMEEMKRREEEELKAAKAAGTASEEEEVPPLGYLDTTVKVKFPLSTRPDLTTIEALNTLLGQFGSIDTASIVLSLKPPKAKKSKAEAAATKLAQPKMGIALVPFRQIGDAFAAVCASNRPERGLSDVKIEWAEGQEPPILGWLKKRGMLNANTKSSSSVPASQVSETNDDGDTLLPIRQNKSESLFANLSKSPKLSSFSSFPESFPTAPGPPPPPKPAAVAAGLDYESLTLMRLRQAERERLEREIREQEAKEG